MNDTGDVADGLGLPRIADALRESEARFRALTNATFGAVYRMSADWTEMRLLGSRHFIDTLEPSRHWVHPDDRPLVLEAIKRAVQAKSTFELEYRVVRADGTLGWTHSRAIPILNARREIVEWFGAASDVTPRKEAEAALEQRAAQQAAVASLSQTALAETSIDDLMDQVVHCVAQTLRTELAKVLELAPGGGELLLRAGVGWKPGLVGRAIVGVERDSQAGFTLLSDGPVVVTDLRTETRFTGPQLLLDHDVVSGMSCVIRGSDGRAYGVLGTHTRCRREFSEDDVNFLRSAANVLAAAIVRRRAEEALREAESRAAAEAAALAKLNELTSRLWQMQGLNEGLKEMLHATVALLGADMGNIQLMEGRALRIVAQRGFAPAFLEHFREVTVEDDSACARALRSGAAVMIEDVETDEGFAPLRAVAREAGYRAVLSTPLIGHDRDTLGMVSVHFKSPHRPSDQDLHRLTLYARQAADFIERCRGEQALRESEQRYRRTFELAGSGIAHIGLDRKFIRVNRRLCEILGYPEHELIGMTGREISHPADLDKINSRRPKLYAGEVDHVYVEKRYVRKDKTVVWVAFSMTVERDAGGTPLYEIAIFDDITERKDAEKALAESEERFRSVSESGVLAIAFFDAAGAIVDANDAFLDLVGYSRAELAAGEVRWDRMTPPEWMPRTREAVAGFRRSGRIEPYEKEYFRKSGERFWGLFGGRRMGSTGEGVAFVLDITERKRAEAALQESKERMQLAMRATHMVTWEWLPLEDRITTSDSFAALYGLPALARAEDGFALVLPEDKETHLAKVQRVAAEGGSYISEFRIRRPDDGRIVWLEERGEAQLDAGGRVSRVIGIALDITERKRAEESLRESEERFRTLADNMDQLAWMADPTGAVLWFNKRWHDYTGAIVEKINASDWRLVHPEHAQRVAERSARCLRQGEAWEETFPLKGRTGEYRWFLCRVVPIKDDEGRLLRWFGTMTDITELEQRNAQLQRLSAQLTAIEQHERRKLAITLHDGLQQLIVAAKLRLPQCLEQDGSEQMQRIDQLLDEAIEAVRSLAWELSPPALGISTLPEALEWLADWFDRQHGFHMRILASEAIPPLPEHAKSLLFSAVREMLLNCVKHSGVDAATLESRTDAVHELQMVIADNGAGFDPARLTYGFGLWSIRDRLVALGGRLVIESAPGMGARFTMLLPLPEAQTKRGSLVETVQGAKAQHLRVSESLASSRDPQSP